MGFAKLALWMFTEVVETALIFYVYLVAGNFVRVTYMEVLGIINIQQLIDVKLYALYYGIGKLVTMEE